MLTTPPCRVPDSANADAAEEALQGVSASGEAEAQWVDVLVQVQAAEEAAHQRKLAHVKLDRSLVGDGVGAELYAEKEALRELGRIIQKAKLSDRMSLPGIGPGQGLRNK